jgi:hypothetical protein
MDEVLRIVAAAALVVLFAVGCGSTARPQPTAAHGLPRALARTWAAEASTIADASAAGDSCRARRLAGSLRTEVISADAKLPGRLRMPLLEAVNSLADRIVCVPPPTAPPKPKPPKEHHPHHHGHGGDEGNQ